MSLRSFWLFRLEGASGIRVLYSRHRRDKDRITAALLRRCRTRWKTVDSTSIKHGTTVEGMDLPRSAWFAHKTKRARSDFFLGSPALR
jgi:hypothetical protein